MTGLRLGLGLKFAALEGGGLPGNGIAGAVICSSVAAGAIILSAQLAGSSVATSATQGQHHHADRPFRVCGHHQRLPRGG